MWCCAYTWKKCINNEITIQYKNIIIVIRLGGIRACKWRWDGSPRSRLLSKDRSWSYAAIIIVIIAQNQSRRIHILCIACNVHHPLPDGQRGRSLVDFLKISFLACVYVMPTRLTVGVSRCKNSLFYLFIFFTFYTYYISYRCHPGKDRIIVKPLSCTRMRV